MVQICQSGSTPIVVPRAGIGPVPSENSATSSITNSAPYRATSTGVRAVPFVSGTRFGHGGSRMVLGRNQYRIDPSGGKNRLFSGPNPQPEADDLEQHGVEHDLLEHDRLGPPLPDVGESVDACGGEREQPPAEDVEQDLERRRTGA